jgi:hypothetical protein
MLKSNINMAILIATVPFAIGWRMLIISFLLAPLPNLREVVAENCLKLIGTLLLLWIYSPFFNGSGGVSKRFLWMLFAAQSWALWTMRNKFYIEAKFPKHPANVVFKTCIFLQLWRPLAKAKVHPMLDEAVAKHKDISKQTLQ